MENPVLLGVPYAGCLRAKVSAYADNTTVFVSRRSNVESVKKAVEMYEEVADAKINFDKNEGLQLGAWEGGVPLPGIFRWSDEFICILGVYFGFGLQLEQSRRRETATFLFHFSFIPLV